MGIETLMVSLFIMLAQLILSLALAMGAVYIGLKLFDKLTDGIDELAELRKGNVAVAILLGAIILSIASVIDGGVSGLMSSISPEMSASHLAASIVIGICNLLLSLILAVFSIYIAITILDKITVDIDEFKELKKGNIAVAIMMAAVLIAVSVVIRAAVVGMSNSLSPSNVAAALGW